ncbi:DUF6266 family protein [Pedobacter sp. PWIIR3]
MGILTNGPHGAITGRVDNLVYYVLNGKNVVRKIGKSYKEPTLPQLRAREITKLSSEFFSRMLDFINVGFGITALGTDKNAFNLAVKENRPQMFKGEYPNLEIDYSRLVVSSGFLKPGEELSSSASAEGISFNWKTDPKMPWAESTDQVMLLAYFPEQDKVVYKLFGNSRIVGNDSLALKPSLLGKYAETYVCFISADRKQISDSIYTGSVNQPVVEEAQKTPAADDHLQTEVAGNDEPAIQAMSSKQKAAAAATAAETNQQSPSYQHIKGKRKPVYSRQTPHGDIQKAPPKDDQQKAPPIDGQQVAGTNQAPGADTGT